MIPGVSATSQLLEVSIPIEAKVNATSPFHPQSPASLPATSSQTHSQLSPHLRCTPTPTPSLFISRSEADLIGLGEAGHTPPCQGLAWCLLAPGGPQALHNQVAAS